MRTKIVKVIFLGFFVFGFVGYVIFTPVAIMIFLKSWILFIVWVLSGLVGFFWLRKIGDRKLRNRKNRIPYLCFAAVIALSGPLSVATAWVANSPDFPHKITRRKGESDD